MFRLLEAIFRLKIEGCIYVYTRGADKSLARPVRKQAAPVKSVMGRRMD